MKLRSYRVVRRQDIVERIASAIELGGGRIVETADPAVAPFRFDILNPDGERLTLICYAFTANKYEQGGRPHDEHRFQVKYGSDFKREHHLYVDPDPASRVVTLFFGVGIGEDAGVFVACDPEMHNPTWFSRSVEFKSAHVHSIREHGWCAWQRERSDARRRVKPRESAETEILLGFTPDNFLRFVDFERQARGLEPGLRMWLAERRAPSMLIEELGASEKEVLRSLEGRVRLKAAVRGALAEDHLKLLLTSTKGVTHVERIEKDGQPDFRVTYQRTRSLRLECKNVLRNLAGPRQLPRVDFQKTRASKGDHCSRYYRPEQFEILAACLFPVLRRWEFRFSHTRTLDAHKTCKGRLDPNVLVGGPQWTSDLPALIESIPE